MLHRLYVVLLIVAGALALPATANAAGCSGTTEVTVVVDFDNGDVEVRCAEVSSGDTGYDVLRTAGFRIANVQDGRNGAALCSIDNVPDHTCTSMPPSSAYWAYYHAKPGGEWGYSSYGGGSYYPKAGSVEGWHYRGSPSNPPGVDPPAAPSPKPTPHPTPKPSSHVTPAHPGGGASNPVVGPDQTATGTGTATPTPVVEPAGTPSTGAPTTSHSAPTSGDTGLTGDTGGTTATSSAAVDAHTVQQPGEASQHSWIWGVLLVVLVAAAAGTTAVRRRRG